MEIYCKCGATKFMLAQEMQIHMTSKVCSKRAQTIFKNLNI